MVHERTQEKKLLHQKLKAITCNIKQKQMKVFGHAKSYMKRKKMRTSNNENHVQRVIRNPK